MEKRDGEIHVAPDEGDSPLSDEARDIDDRARGAITDLTDFDVRKRKDGLMSWRYLVAYFLLVLAIIVGITYATRSESTDAASDTTPVAAVVADSDAPLGGTWKMYTTGSDDSERHAFTLRFDGFNVGTVEVLEDDSEFDATFELVDEELSFSFTRIFEVETGDWSEMSVFTGAFVSENEISGQYVRENWSCLPNREPVCAYEPEPLRFSARIVREP